MTESPKPLGMSDFFALEAGEYLERLDGMLAQGDSPSADEIVRLARALRGSALMANQPAIARAAAGLEVLARAVREGRRAWDPQTQQLALRAVDDLKIFVRRAGSWTDADTAKAEALAVELEQVAGRPSAQIRAVEALGLDAGARAFVAREGAAIAGALERAAQALRANPRAHDPLQHVLRALQPLRGLAALTDLPPLPDLLEGIERAIGELSRSRLEPPTNLGELFQVAGSAIARAAREVAERGRPDPEGPDFRQFAGLLVKVMESEPDAVSIGSLYYSDSGPHIVSRGVPAARPSTLGKLELVSHGEHLRQAADSLERAPSATQRELRAHTLGTTFRALANAGGGVLADRVAQFAIAGREAVASGIAVSSAAAFAAELRRAGDLLVRSGTGDEEALATRARPQPLLPAPPLRLPRRPPPWTCAPCCIAATARSSERRSCAQRRSGRRATSSARSSTKSATSLPSPSSPAPSRASASPSPSRWAWILGLAVTVAFLAWAVRGTQWSDVLAGLRAVDPLLLVLTVALATLTFPIRLIRWRVILRDERERPLPWLPLWHAVAIGFMANNLLPARAGEFARAYVASRQLPVRFTTALGSIGVERVFDALVMLGLMALAIASPSFPAHSTLLDTPLSRLAGRAALLFGAMFVVALVVVLRPTPWLALFERVTRTVLPARLAARVAGMAEGLVAGLTVLKRPGRFGAMLFWSLVLWLTNAASFAVCFRAFGLQVPIEGSLLLQGILGFAVAVPASAGFFGVFEKATQLTLQLYGISPSLALAYAVAYHVSTFLPITLLGLRSLASVHLHLGDLGRARTADQLGDARP